MFTRRHALAALLFPCLAAASETALDRYVKAPDPSYRFEIVETRPGAEATEYLVDMVSQTWRSKEEVDRTEWRHWLTLVVPKQVKHDTAFLFITGGSNDGKRPRSPRDLHPIAIDTGSVVAELRMVPNQPLTFAGEQKGRTEDSIIAYTWDKFLRGGDERWPLRLPMTKAAIRAMDTITSVCGKLPGGAVKVDKFVVAGASKRGWTTWTTAAVDRRVVAIVPIVIDVLNVEQSMQHHFRAYGFWAPAIGDYEENGIVNWFGTPENRRLMAIEDPLSYRDRLTVPKFLINASGDQFFLPDSSQFYFDQLTGEKYLRYVPNADHSLKNSDALQSLHAFYSAVLAERERPKFKWHFDGKGVRVTSSSGPSEVRLWQATNPRARDFRLETLGPVWTSTVLRLGKQGEYRAEVAAPRAGYTAYFVELTFPSGGRFPFKFTTPVHVTPQRLPFPPPPQKK